MIEFVHELPHISMAAETLFHIGGFPVTNSLVATWLSMLLLIIVSLLFCATAAQMFDLYSDQAPAWIPAR